MRRSAVLLLLVVAFVVSLFTNTIGPLIPEVITTFQLSLTAAGLLPFAFFAAYGLTSIPAGILIERSSEKLVMVAAFVVALGAALAFALFPRYAVALLSIFTIGASMAAVQVALNPLLRVVGGPERFAIYSTLVQLVFGAGSFVGPRIYAGLVARGAPWISLYWIFAAVAAASALLVGLAPLPRAPRTDDDGTGSLAAHRALLAEGVVGRYFVGIFMYVGSEQGVASWLSQFLATYHGVDPRTGGASAVSWFWGLMTIGCVVGLVTLKLFDSRRVLVVHAALALVLLALGLYGPTPIAVLALPAIGFVASVMWPVIFALALNSVRAHHGTVSGILCTAIIGGAIVPLLVGRLGDVFGLRAGMSVVFLTFGWVLVTGLRAPSRSS